MVTLYGEILSEDDRGVMLFRVMPGKGDAAALRFPARSEFYIARRQCQVREARLRGELDELRLSYELASLKRQNLVPPQETPDGQVQRAAAAADPRRAR